VDALESRPSEKGCLEGLGSNAGRFLRATNYSIKERKIMRPGIMKRPNDLQKHLILLKKKKIE